MAEELELEKHPHLVSAGLRKVVARFPTEASGIALVFAVLVDASDRWRGVRMRGDITARLKQLAVDPDSSWHDPDLATLAA